jgi:hypothetical protein
MTLLAVQPEELAVYAKAATLLLAIDDARQGSPWRLIETLWGRIVSADEVVADPGCLTRLRQHGERYIVIDGPQREIIAATMDLKHRKVWVKGNTGCGKSFAIGLCAVLFYTIWPDAIVVLTRDSYETAAKLTFGEVARWWQAAAYRPHDSELQAAAIIDVTNRQHTIRVASPKSNEGFAGSHSEHVLFVFDEASAAVLEDRYPLADTQATKFLACANPRTVAGHFRKAYDCDTPDENQSILRADGYERLITIGGDDCLNVRARRLSKPVAPQPGITIAGRTYRHGETISHEHFAQVGPIIPGQTCWDQLLGLRAKPDRAWVAVMADGRFPSENLESALIRRAWLRPHRERHNHWQRLMERVRTLCEARRTRWQERLNRLLPIQSYGLDVGGSTEGDPSVLTAGGERGVRAQWSASLADAEQLADWVVATCRDAGADCTTGAYPLAVDCDGIGWGVAGILRRRGVRVIEFRGNDSPKTDPKRYANRRAEAYGEVARRVDPRDAAKGLPWALPDDELLVQELTAPERLVHRDGLKVGITPKRRGPGQESTARTVQDIIGRSPDRADSLVYWYAAQQHVGLSLEHWLEVAF